MSSIKYPLPCFHTGRALAEGDESQLREYFNALGKGDPFDEHGQLRVIEPSFNQAMPEAPQSGPHLTLTKS